MSTPRGPSSSLRSPEQRRGGPVSNWLAGWRLALRMARRDIGRDRVRTGFVWCMIALPVAVICAIQVVVASNDLSERERLDLQLGGSQAALNFVGFDGGREFDGVGTLRVWDDDEERSAARLAGWGESPAKQGDAVAAMAGQPALVVTWSESIGPNGLLVLTLGIDAARPDAAGVVQLTGGRLPARPGEVLVTPAGLVNGLPASGVLRLQDDDERPFEVTVVGTAEVTYEGIPDLIGSPESSPEGTTFLLTGDRPVTWEDAMRFADHGFQTASAYLAANPPPGLGPDRSVAEAGRAFTAALIAAAALLEVALVTGPAFAIGAARQRRNLALAAVNGAPPAQLRRVALGQAVLLSISAALVGTAAGTAAGVGIWPLLSSDPTQLHGPLEVPVVQLVAACVLAVVAAMASALVAARGLGRLDLVATLRGSLRSAAGDRKAPRLGGVLVVGGLLLAWLVGTVVQPDASAWAFVIWCTGAVAVLSGVLLVVPALLGWLGRLGERAPVASRLALRETSRQRGRAASTVAAITAGGVVLGVIWTVMASSQAEEALEYSPRLPYGQASVSFRNWEQAERTLGRAEAIVAEVDSSLLTVRTAWVEGWLPEGEADEPRALIAVNPGCDPAAVVRTEEPPLSCLGIRGGFGGARQSILVASADDLDRLFGLSDDQSQALRNGWLLVDTSSEPVGTSRYQAPATVVLGGEVRFARFDDELSLAAIEQVPALTVPPEVIERGASRHLFGALMTADAATERGWAMRGWRLQVFSRTAPISADLETRLTEALQPAGFTIAVERGWQPSVDSLVWSITGTVALLAVVAAAMATVLGVAELRPFLGTFAAVGADPGLSRRLASAQAWLLGLVGSGLGVAIGLAIGAPLAIASTSHLGLVTPVLALPWQLAAALVVGVPLVAAGVAAASVPAHPALVRRLA